jgi:hypothetical protein
MEMMIVDKNHSKKQFVWITLIGFSILSLWVSGCRNHPETTADESLSFSTPLETNANQETHVSMVVTNASDHIFPADNEFDGEMKLWNQDGTLLSSIEAPSMRTIQPGESVFLSNGRWNLEPDIYILTWGSPKYGGIVTVFSVVEMDERLYLGKSQSFTTQPADYDTVASRSGSFTSITMADDDTWVIQGETPLPDHGCLLPLVLDPDGILTGFPLGRCANIADGQWRMQIPSDPASPVAELNPDTSYTVILLSEDLTIPPSEPFVIFLSPPPQKS